MDWKFYIFHRSLVVEQFRLPRTYPYKVPRLSRVTPINNIDAVFVCSQKPSLGWGGMFFPLMDTKGHFLLQILFQLLETLTRSGYSSL